MGEKLNQKQKEFIELFKGYSYKKDENIRDYIYLGLSKDTPLEIRNKIAYDLIGILIFGEDQIAKEVCNIINEYKQKTKTVC